METRRFEVPGLLVSDVHRSGPANPGRVYLLLHGYEMSGAWLFKRLEPVLKELAPDSLILAPNGPYPLPRKKEGGFEVGFSWYFYDPGADEYYIGMKPALSFLQGLLKQLGVLEKPVTVIGFSQGGYLAPFLAPILPGLDHVVGIGCRFLDAEVDVPLLRSRGIVLDGIHGAEDAIVKPDESRESHRKLAQAGVAGSFTLVPGGTHRIDAGTVDALRQSLKASRSCS